MRIQIVTDANIPFIEDVFSEIGDVHLIPGHELGPDEVKTADVLVVRSVRRIDATLLDGSRVRFVASATAGVDHVDIRYLSERGIGFAHAPGANAESVVEYVLASIYEIAARSSTTVEGKTIGIVGCGAVGSKLSQRAQSLGLRVLLNDPPLARLTESRGEKHDYISLSSLLRRSDFVTIHVPLTHDGPNPTFHLVRDGEISLLPSKAWLINTSRGGVVDEMHLTRAIREKRVSGAVTDVWESEPSPDPVLHVLTKIATPHIAGYSYDAKLASTEAVAEATRAFFNLQPGTGPVISDEDTFELEIPDANFVTSPDQFIHELISQMYPIIEDHARMACLIDYSNEDRQNAFRALRTEYPVRRTFRRFSLVGSDLTSDFKRRLRRGLGINIH